MDQSYVCALIAMMVRSSLGGRGGPLLLVSRDVLGGSWWPTSRRAWCLVVNNGAVS